METIINIEEYRKRKEYEELEQRIIKLAFGLWESEDERIRYMIEQSEKDSEEWEKLYPISDDIAE